MKIKVHMPWNNLGCLGLRVGALLRGLLSASMLGHVLIDELSSVVDNS